MKTKLAVFDMDGTLFDTTEVNYYSYAEAVNQYGYTINKEEFYRFYSGTNYKDFLPAFGITNPIHLEQIHEAKKELYPLFLNRAKQNVPLFKLINTIKVDYVIVLATTASRKNVLDILQCFNVEALFDFLITQEDTMRLKPDPECYLLAMERAGIDAKDTIIFEDSEIGLQAARDSMAFPIKAAI